MSVEQKQPGLSGSIVKHSLILGLFAIAVALSVGLVNEATRDEIRYQQQQAERRALAAVMPSALHDNDLLDGAFPLTPEDSRFNETALLGLKTERNAYLATEITNGNTDTVGIILPVNIPDGYSGDIQLLVGILQDGSLSGVRVVSHRETPGLGDKIDLRVSDWILGFNDKSLDNPEASLWAVKKDGGEFDQFVGATITPRAVVNGVRRALEFYQLNREALLSLP